MGNTTHPPKRKDSNNNTGSKHPNAAHSGGAFSFFNPTARYHIIAPSVGSQDQNPTRGEKEKKKKRTASDELSLTGNEAANVLGQQAADDAKQAVAELPVDADVPTLSAEQIGRALETTDSQLSGQSSLRNAANAATVTPERLAGALNTSPSQVGRVVQLGMGNSNDNGSKTSINTTQQKQREQEQKDSGVYYVWRSRDNRKGRHAAIVTKPGILQQGKNDNDNKRRNGGNNKGSSDKEDGNEKEGKDKDGGNYGTGKKGSWRHKRRLQDEEMGEGIDEEDTREEERGEGPRATNTLRMTWHGVLKMFTSFPWWDISYVVALSYFIAAIARMINGFFVYLPLAAPKSEFKGEEAGSAATRLITTTLVVISSILMLLEAVNENRADCFGWALEESLSGNADGPRLRSHEHEGTRCTHHHQVRYVLLRGSNARDQRKAVVVPVSVSVPDDQNLHNEKKDDPDAHSDGDDDGHGSESDDSDGKGHDNNGHHNSQHPSRAWKWWPSPDELKSHYLHEIGFLSCLIQLIGAVIFWTEGFTGLPFAQNNLSTGALNGSYWLPQVVGGVFFIVSAILTMVEVQDKWYVPAPNLLGWHIGLWSLVGSIGLTVTGALGFAENAGPQYEYAIGMATFVSSWAFLIASVILLFEALNKYPLTVSTAPPGREPHIRPDAEQQTGS
ncbi:hypothetical protein SMACR_03105 [Sordaria macrospora]|uniref:WGS project CABT00000000 data, contig 2.7 n=2 Tax=Sordaria macrospora TaxID=5147 RepID=F7VU78_SORMK|nr:uncharacterized protein SMAC_03105 [Sordaria macrospora k-hell]KAA8634420.1 hypothetical protein SMACR_03105 [Sordaria macrospora]WPJ60672.1 hypothetical protein SMAC4_03105 [Sordaria macrospora]CCC09066.1 unnamed protein product [Sordaria macrospora k-hell]